MLDMVTTNGATILTMLALWSTVTWAFTYIYMGRKVADANERIEGLDWYCYYSDREIEKLMEEMNLLRQEVDGKNDYISHLCKIIDGNSTDYYLTDKGMEVL